MSPSCPLQSIPILSNFPFFIFQKTKNRRTCGTSCCQALPVSSSHPPPIPYAPAPIPHQLPCILSPPPCFPPSPPIARPILHQPPCCPSAHARVLRQQAALLSWAGATGEQDGRYRGPRAFHSFLFHHSLVLDSRTLFSWAPKSLQMVTAAMQLKDACFLKKKL